MRQSKVVPKTSSDHCGQLSGVTSTVRLTTRHFLLCSCFLPRFRKIVRPSRQLSLQFSRHGGQGGVGTPCHRRICSGQGSRRRFIHPDRSTRRWRRCEFLGLGTFELPMTVANDSLPLSSRECRLGLRENSLYSLLHIPFVSFNLIQVLSVFRFFFFFCPPPLIGDQRPLRPCISIRG